MKTTAENFGAVIRQVRTDLGLTQDVCASRIKPEPWPQSLWSKYERGVKNPTLKTIVAMCRARGCEVEIRIRPKLAEVDVQGSDDSPTHPRPDDPSEGSA